MDFTISYYSEAVQADILALPPTLLARYLSLADRMELHGPNLGEPHTQAFGEETPLHERRVAETRMKEIKHADSR